MFECEGEGVLVGKVMLEVRVALEEAHNLEADEVGGGQVENFRNLRNAPVFHFGGEDEVRDWRKVVVLVGSGIVFVAGGSAIGAWRVLLL